MSDNDFDPSVFDYENLTPRQRDALRRDIIGRARVARDRAIFKTMADMIAAVRKAWRRTCELARARAALRAMSDLELWDMGLSRTAIEAAIRHNETDAADDRSQRGRVNPPPRPGWREGNGVLGRSQNRCRLR